MPSFIHSGPRSLSSWVPGRVRGGSLGGIALSLPPLCPPTPILHRAPLPLPPPHRVPAPWSGSIPFQRGRPGGMSLSFPCGALGRGPHSARHGCEARRVCTRLRLAKSVHSQSPLLTTAPAPAPHPHAGRPAHTAPRCSGERRSGCLPRREAAGLQVLKILFEEEVLAGVPDRLPGCAPTCSTQGACSCAAASAWQAGLSRASRRKSGGFPRPSAGY